MNSCCGLVEWSQWRSGQEFSFFQLESSGEDIHNGYKAILTPTLTATCGGEEAGEKDDVETEKLSPCHTQFYIST